MLALGRRHIVPLAGQALVEISVGLRLVLQAAHQPPAAARDLRRVEGQVLVLCHFDRNRREFAQPGVAAQRPAAAPDAAEQLRLVADADLPELDARAENAGQVLHELAEINPSVGREIEENLAVVKGVLRLDELHVEPSCGDLLLADAESFFLPRFIFALPRVVLLRRHADHLFQGTRHLLIRQLGRGDDDGPVLDAAGGLHDHVVMIPDGVIGGVKVIDLAGISELDADNLRHCNSP